MNRARAKRGAEWERQLLLVEEPLGVAALSMRLIQDALDDPKMAPLFLNRALAELARLQRVVLAWSTQYPYGRR
ncbi:MAG TPA: hypothetical protein VM537_02915 [Anaerolineae bacterium]|nr:hypothetical protein [Anaerolineae bacterium]